VGTYTAFAVRTSLLLAVLAAACTPEAVSPRIALSRDKVLDRGHVTMEGMGFTPRTPVISHLKRPDGTEHPELRFLTDDNGAFTHVIDAYLFQEGTYEVWVIDPGGVSSNVARFEVGKEAAR
jgi:hypothetical protein